MQIGLIAGSGQFPFMFCTKAQSLGHCIYAAGIIGQTDRIIEGCVKSMAWFHLGQVQRMIGYFKSHGVDRAVMMGAVDKTRIFADVKPDAKAISIVSRMKHIHDDALLRAFADVLAEEGITVLPSTIFLPELLAPMGCWSKRKPTADEIADIRLGYAVSKKIGELDIGQTVVVGGGTVLAVEAVDGTDATVKRGGALGKGFATVIKTSKPRQDLRFDVPAVGVETIAVMRESGIRALAVEAGKTIVFDMEHMVRLADEYGMAVIAVDGEF